MKNEANPKLKLKELDSEEGHELCHGPNMSKNPSQGKQKFVGNEKGKEKKLARKKMAVQTRFASLRHSRSDDPLLYVEFDADDGQFIPSEDFEALSQKIKNFSWEERTLNSNLFPEEEKAADDEDEEEEKKK